MYTFLSAGCLGGDGVAVCCSVLQCVRRGYAHSIIRAAASWQLQHTATHCNTLLHTATHTNNNNESLGWLQWVGSLKLQVSLAEYRLFYKALLQKRPMILRSLLIPATPSMPWTLIAVAGVCCSVLQFIAVCCSRHDTSSVRAAGLRAWVFARVAIYFPVFMYAWVGGGCGGDGGKEQSGCVVCVSVHMNSDLFFMCL